MWGSNLFVNEWPMYCNCSRSRLSSTGPRKEPVMRRGHLWRILRTVSSITRKYCEISRRTLVKDQKYFPPKDSNSATIESSEYRMIVVCHGKAFEGSVHKIRFRSYYQRSVSPQECHNNIHTGTAFPSIIIPIIIISPTGSRIDGSIDRMVLNGS